MIFYHRFRWFIRLFYFCGFSPKITSTSTFVSFANKLPTIIFFAFSVAQGVWIAIEVNSQHKQASRSLEDLLTNIFLLGDTFKLHCVYAKSLYLGYLMIDILRDFDAVNKIFADFETWHIDYRPLHRSYSWKFVLATTASVLSILVFGLESLRRPGNYAAVVFRLWQLKTTLSVMQVVLYVDMLHYHLQQLNEVIQHNGSISIDVLMRKNWKESIMLKKIRNYKSIHCQLMVISQKINHLFGWTIWALLLQSFIDSTNCSFRLYTSLRRHHTMFNLLSERLWITCLDSYFNNYYSFPFNIRRILYYIPEHRCERDDIDQCLPECHR